MFFKRNAHQGCIYLMENTVNVLILLQFKITLFYFKILKCKLIPVMATLNFQQFSVSHDPSEIILIMIYVIRTFLILSMLKTMLLLNIFLETVIFFRIMQLIKISKEQYLFEIYIFLQFYHLVLIVASLLNKKSHHILKPEQMFYCHKKVKQSFFRLIVETGLKGQNLKTYLIFNLLYL